MPILMPYFEHPVYFYLLFFLLPIAYLFAGIVSWKQIKLSEIASIEQARNLLGNYSKVAFFIKFIVPVISLTAIVFSLAGFQTVQRFTEARQSANIIIAIDASNSMLCKDVTPSRLEVSKKLASDIVKKFVGSKVGLIVFSGKAFTQSPLTDDAEILQMYIKGIGTDAAPIQGTSISSALQLADTLNVNNRGRQSTALVLITDGETHDSASIAIAKSFVAKKLPIYTIGIGTPEGGAIVENGQSKTDKYGRPIISKLNESLLQELAFVSGGKYFAGANVTGLKGELMNAANKSGSNKTIPTAHFYSYYAFFAALALLLMVAEFFIPETKAKWRVSQ